MLGPGEWSWNGGIGDVALKFVPSLWHVPFLSSLCIPVSLHMCWPCLPRIHGYVLTLCLCVSVMAATMDFLTWYPLSESTLHRYEVHPYGTLPVGPGPEFKTTLRVRSWRGAAWHEEGGGEESWEKTGRVS